MPTQIVHFDVDAAPCIIHVRNDVSKVLIVAMAEGRPVNLLRMPRPDDGALSSDDILNRMHLEERPPVGRRAAALPPLSIVIPTHERPDDLARCLESLSG